MEKHRNCEIESITHMDQRLHYRRQFLLVKAPIEPLAGWGCTKINQYYVYSHPDLTITKKETTATLVILIGDIFDPFDPEKTNEHIASDIISRVIKFEDLIGVLKRYAGRYAIIYLDETSFSIMNDPLSLREIYYCTEPNRVICGSQPNLIDAFSEPKLGITQDKNTLHFYEHEMRSVRSGRLWVGDETYYHNVKHLMPNHYLDINLLKTKRYWPNRKLERMDLDIAVKQSCDYLKGVLKAVTSRYNVMMAVTSGTDSRSLLAASRELKDQIYYFINKEPPLTDKSADIRIPRSIFSKLNIPFHVHNVEGPVDEEFKTVFLNNVFMSTELILPTIYNVYYKNHQDKVNLLGVGEIGREFYGEAPSDLTGYYLARCLKFKRSQYAIVQCERWLKGTKEIAEACNVDIMRLLLWECLLGSWGVVGNSESDIAIEEFDPYDSHYIYEIMLSVDGAQGDLFKAMFKAMWPELLEFPFNPPETAKDWIRQSLQRMGLFQKLKMLRYRFDYWKFRRLASLPQE